MKNQNENSANSDESGVTLDGIREELYQHSQDHANTELLNKILESGHKIKEVKSKEIIESKPILALGEVPIFFPRTINTIQGQTGAHKSRFSEYPAATLLNRCKTHSQELLDFVQLNGTQDYSVVVVDSERNQHEQFPKALQSIQAKAGFNKTDDPEKLYYVSLIDIPREDRFTALNTYLEYLRTVTDDPLFVVLDVSTDCIADFNNVESSMKLIDMMNEAINKYDIVFLCLIHENPRSDKARGHFGTELVNKSTTAIQIAFEKDASHNDTDLIKIRVLKCRNVAKMQPIYVEYCEEVDGLVLAGPDAIQKARSARQRVCNTLEIGKNILGVFNGELTCSRDKLINALAVELKVSKRTIENRLKEIRDEQIPISNEGNQNFHLTKIKEGKQVTYALSALKD
jgi:hypothetical protein